MSTCAVSRRCVSRASAYLDAAAALTELVIGGVEVETTDFFWVAG